MDLQIVLTTVIAVVASLAFLLAGFNALLSPIKKDIGRLEAGQIHLGKRLDHLESRFNDLESRFNSLESRFNSLESKVNSLDSKIDQLLART